MYSLRTKSVVVATSRAQRAAQQFDEHWYHLRIQDVDLPGKHLLRTGAKSLENDVGGWLATLQVAAPNLAKPCRIKSD